MSNFTPNSTHSASAPADSEPMPTPNLLALGSIIGSTKDEIITLLSGDRARDLSNEDWEDISRTVFKLANQKKSSGKEIALVSEKIYAKLAQHDKLKKTGPNFQEHLKEQLYYLTASHDQYSDYLYLLARDKKAIENLDYVKRALHKIYFAAGKDPEGITPCRGPKFICSIPGLIMFTMSATLSAGFMLVDYRGYGEQSDKILAFLRVYVAQMVVKLIYDATNSLVFNYRISRLAYKKEAFLLHKAAREIENALVHVSQHQAKIRLKNTLTHYYSACLYRPIFKFYELILSKRIGIQNMTAAALLSFYSEPRKINELDLARDAIQFMVLTTAMICVLEPETLQRFFGKSLAAIGHAAHTIRNACKSLGSPKHEEGNLSVNPSSPTIQESTLFAPAYKAAIDLRTAPRNFYQPFDLSQGRAPLLSHYK